MSDASGDRAADSRLGHTMGVVVGADPAGLSALRLGGLTLAERATSLLAEICEQVRRLDETPAPTSRSGPSGGSDASGGSDSSEGSDAMGEEREIAAVIAALEAADSEHVLVLSADRPLLSPDLLIGLAGLPDADAVMPRTAAGPDPLCARYRRATALPALRAAAETGSVRLDHVLHELDVCWLEGESLAALDPEGVALSRIARASELDALASRHPERVRGPWPGHPGLGLPRLPG